ncbi:MAG: sulfur carrier protein ThiS [Nitrosomonadales bacterium]|nr:sulfur carrier protein ThiS [Nitrosomonadales bacterium]
MISVLINGTAHELERAISVDELVQRMELGGKRIALERNGEIVPRSQFPQQMLADGDKLEIVVAVGGG